MGIRRLNHAVLYVRSVPRAVAFYRDVLGFTVVTAFADRAAFLRAADSDNDHDLGLFAVGADARGPVAGQVGLYHLAWSVRTLAELAGFRTRLTAAGALVGASDHGVSKSLYAKDPDGVEFEVSWFVPRDRVTPAMESVGVAPLDLDAELAQWGPDLVGAP
ncbi:VOC family protein [Actinokineospora bangkokensis]|uniref:Glyoxalase n=1 Tax=Actinokineospora bangkokensis TaxID=1193682 RepID=A0A1Q9LEF3_9PSEU|nr:VOC family protein [Actinokineospora bangkokensis]OLR90418.1 glyoxalase [Actinokineospora bangkokensis]